MTPRYLASHRGIFFFFFFKWGCLTCRILVPPPGIEPMPAVMDKQSPNHRTTRELLRYLLKG